MDELEDFPDVEALLVQLLRPLLPGVRVLAALDISDSGTWPLVAISVGPPDEIDHDQPAGYNGYSYPVSLVSVDDSRVKSRALAVKAHNAIRSLDCAGEQIPGLGLIATVNSTLLPHRTGSADIQGNDVTQSLSAYDVEAFTS